MSWPFRQHASAVNTAVNESLSFLSAFIGTLFDPVVLAGCVLAGWLFRPRWVAIVAAVEWNVFIYAVMLKLAFRDEYHARFFISGAQYLGSSAAAISAALFTQWLVARDRRQRPETAIGGDEKPAQKKRQALAIGSVLALAGALAAWVAYAKSVLYYFHDLNGPAYYWERANLDKHYWAIEYPLYAGLVLLAMALFWLFCMIRFRQWPRSCLFLIAAYVYVEFLFWAALGFVDMSHFL